MIRRLSLVAAVLVVLSAAALAQNKSGEKEGASVQPQNSKIDGLLIDAGCRDRTVWNMTRAPVPLQNAIAPTGQGNRPGQQMQSTLVNVAPSTIDLERADAMQVIRNSDSAVRQNDPTCAIKGNTRAFALLLDSGRLLDLDDGGNTYAAAMVSSTPQGRAMLNSQSGGFKPRVRVTGWIQGDRLYTENLNVLR